MKKYVIKVPDYIRYMSEWKEYVFPEGHCIVDKGVTGCGYTEYCLRNDLNVVLCSPRKLLLENKYEQHKDEENVLYLYNNIEGFRDSKSFEEIIKDHIVKNGYYNFSKKLSGIKILVTYDSCFRVVKVLKNLGLLKDFHFIIDEFQAIFLDSYFKSSVELDFVETLQECPNVLYLSATPMLDKYLSKIQEFKDLPFYELDWEETGVVEKILVKRKFTTSLSGECNKIIQEEYLSEKFYTTLNRNNSLVVSKEAVFYFNSIGDITRVIKKNKLLPSQVNIICADTQENKNKLSRLSNEMSKEDWSPKKNFGKFTIGRIPLKGEPNKMFTFCTKTAYIGSDFHSTNARSFVFADPNIRSLALDISLDLPQIVGRQRDIENPFKNDITIFYRTIRKSEMSDRGEFDRVQKKRREETLSCIDLYNTASDNLQRTVFLKKIRDSIEKRNYSDDFVSVSTKTGEPVYNSLIEIANERAWEVSQVDYQDKINVTKALEKVSDEVSLYQGEYEKIIQDFLNNHFYTTGIFREKMKMYCEFCDQHLGNKEIEDILYYKIQDDRFRRYYRFYGTSGCRASRFEEKPLQEGMLSVSKSPEIESSVKNLFSLGGSYTLKEIKETLGNLYRDLGVTSKPKATDLGRYFKLTRVKFTDPQTKKRIEGYKLDSL